MLSGCLADACDEVAGLGDITAKADTELCLSLPGPLDAVSLAKLRALRTVVAAYVAITFPVQRPRELLATQRINQLAETIATLRTSKPRPRPNFTSLRLSAAGADSPEMVRFLQELGEACGLPPEEEGDLLLRVRRAPEGWQVLLRITPRPLATRPWRSENYPGALNGTIAASIMRRMAVGEENSLLDLTCGTGTLLIEQLHLAAPKRCVGIDLNPAAIQIAQLHQRQAKRKGRIEWLCADSTQIDIEGGFDRIVCNPPWGTLVGEHETNADLYAALLQKAADLAAPNALFGVLSHEVKRTQRVIAGQNRWEQVGEQRYFQKGHHPRLFTLRLRGN
ncbi:methyltransferase domain-containing protein [Dermabacteraceae bacterium P13138]